MNQTNLLSLKEASDWATNYLGKKISTSNITYLIQYGRVSKIDYMGNIHVDFEELKKISSE
jgi:hypothetical protein